MNRLYPLKFNPILKDKIWGGSKLSQVLGKPMGDLPNLGESWEISGVKDNLSVVSNGFLKDNTIEELIEIYMGDLVGEKVYDKFGLEFPLLIKFIDANDFLSIQVHPDDDLALERHNSYGKTEMWYVIDADKDAELIAGFNQEMSKAKYLQHFAGGTLREVLNFDKVSAGDVYYMPAGRVHATGPGILFAEIQQTSDITYRIYDWDRLGDDGKPRELHTELAVDAIDYGFEKNYKTPYKLQLNQSAPVIKSTYFTTNIIEVNQELERDYNQLDSFVIFMGIEGNTQIRYYDNEVLELKKGETVLVPADIKELFIKPLDGTSRMLEVYVEL